MACRFRFPHPFERPGLWTNAICHGGDNKDALVFKDGEVPRESRRSACCHPKNCDATAIRHTLQHETGLWTCR